jgi:hypothetical protein
MGAGGVPVDVVIEAGVLAPQPLQHRFVGLGWGSLTHRTSVPYLELLAHLGKDARSQIRRQFPAAGPRA